MQIAPADFDRMFGALADYTRRDIVRRAISSQEGVADLASHYPMSFAAVQKHIALLERAGLVTKQRIGRRKVVRTDLGGLWSRVACSTSKWAAEARVSGGSGTEPSSSSDYMRIGPTRDGVENAPVSTQSVMGFDDTTVEVTQLYAGDRGVFRIYRGKVTDDEWRLERAAPASTNALSGCSATAAGRSRAGGKPHPTAPPGSSTSRSPTAGPADHHQGREP